MRKPKKVSVYLLQKKKKKKDGEKHLQIILPHFLIYHTPDTPSPRSLQITKKYSNIDYTELYVPGTHKQVI